jgi:hypothetical protein
MAQVVECLLCKQEALNSNPSPTKKKKKRKEYVACLIKTFGHFFSFAFVYGE